MGPPLKNDNAKKKKTNVRKLGLNCLKVVKATYYLEMSKTRLRVMLNLRQGVAVKHNVMDSSCIMSHG